MYSVGIDLGTTNVSCHIGYTQNEQIHVELLDIAQIVNSEKGPVNGYDKYLPSLVFFYENQAFTGSYIYSHLSTISSKPKAVIAQSIKNHIADDFWHCGEPGKHSYNVIETTAVLLKTVWYSIHNKGIKNSEINRIVITIPASFSSKMRQNTLLAAKLTGMPTSKIQLVDEPVAALFSDLEPANKTFKSITESEKVLVYDLGGGTIDVSIIQVSHEKKIIEILASSRYNNIGGSDWDLEIAAFILERLEKHVDYNSFFKDSDRVDSRSKYIKLLSVSKKIKESIDMQLEKIGRIRDKKAPLGRELSELIKKNLINEQIPLDLSLIEDLTPSVITVSLNDLLDSFQYLLSLKLEEGSFFTPIDQALDPETSGLRHDISDIADIETVFLTGGGSNSQLVKNQLSFKVGGEYIKLDTKYAISKGAVNYALLFNELDEGWKLLEKTTAKIFIGVSGRSFVEIFDSGKSIPSEVERIELLEEGIHLRQIAVWDTRKNCYRLSLYQGVDNKDPLLRPFIELEINAFQRLNMNSEITVRAVRGKVDANRIYSFSFEFEDKNGEMETGEVEFKIDQSSNSSPHMAFKKPSVNNIKFFQEIMA